MWNLRNTKSLWTVGQNRSTAAAAKTALISYISSNVFTWRTLAFGERNILASEERSATAAAAAGRHSRWNPLTWWSHQQLTRLQRQQLRGRWGDKKQNLLSPKARDRKQSGSKRITSKSLWTGPTSGSSSKNSTKNHLFTLLNYGSMKHIGI